MLLETINVPADEFPSWLESIIIVMEDTAEPVKEDAEIGIKM